MQVAAKVEHVVVRGTKAATGTTRRVVNHVQAYESSLMEHHQDPPVQNLKIDMEIDRGRQPPDSSIASGINPSIPPLSEGQYS